MMSMFKSVVLYVCLDAELAPELFLVEHKICKHRLHGRPKSLLRNLVCIIFQ